MGIGRDMVRALEKATVAAVRGTRAFAREVVDVLDEAPKAFDRVSDALTEVVEYADQGISEPEDALPEKDPRASARPTVAPGRTLKEGDRKSRPTRPTMEPQGDHQG